VSTLVTGGNGFLGSHLTRELLRQGHRVRVLAQEGTDTRRIDGLDVELVRGDLLSRPTLEQACTGIELVFHLAGVVQDHGPADLFKRVNVGGTRNLLHAAIDCQVRRLIFTSSLAVHRYRGISHGDESWPRDNLRQPYGASKIACEDLLLQAHRERRIETVIVRPGVFPFGPDDRLVLPQLVHQRRRFRYVAGGRARLCTAFAPNLAQGLVLCGTVGRAAGEVYVIADDETPTWRELMERLFGGLQLDPPRRSVPLWLALTGATLAEGWAAVARPAGGALINRYRVALSGRDCVFVNHKARAELGWDPQVGLEQALARTTDWLREQLQEHGA